MRDNIRARVAFALALVALALVTALPVATRPRVRAFAPEPNADYGYKPNPAASRDFLKTLAEPTFRVAGADCIRKAQGRDTYLYRSMYRAHAARYGKPFAVGRQEIGDCCGWGWRHAIYVTLAVAWELGEIDEPPLLPDPCVIYGLSRVEAAGHPGDGARAYGGFQDGSYGAACAKAASEWGICYQTDYGGGYDLTGYSGERATEYGAYGCGGKNDGGKLDAIAKQTPVQYVALCESAEDAFAAIESGFCVAVASDQGFEMVRDETGTAQPRGTWYHMLAMISCRYKKNGHKDDQILILNSWGISAHSGGLDPPDQPEGSFWISRAVADRMLKQSDSYAVGNVKFQWRDIEHNRFLGLPPGE